MLPELQSKVDEITKSLGISAHPKGTVMEVDLNWVQLNQLFEDMYNVLAIRHRSVMGSIEKAQWVSVYRAMIVRRIQFVRETVLGARDLGYRRVNLSKALRMHGAAHTVMAHIGLFKSDDLGYRFIPKLPPEEWAVIDNEAFRAHADVLEALRSRGVVISEGFPSEPSGSMAYLLLVKEVDDGRVIASAPSKEATPNDGMMASVVFRTKNVMLLSYGYDFSPVATPDFVVRQLLGTYMGGVHAIED